jgi:lipoyl(octanoyl) transferase
MQLIRLGRRAYPGVEAAMREFTAGRGPDTEDQLWIVEHDPVFTQGVAGRAGHVLAAGDIPVVQTNRGGQVTYHGPGQVVAYPLLDLRAAASSSRKYVFRLEEAVLRHAGRGRRHGPPRARRAGRLCAAGRPVIGHARLAAAAPGEDPFAGLGKIAALGLKVSRHCTYHGVALNVAMDLEPFSRIDPCGYAGLRTVDLRGCGVGLSWDEAASRLARHLQALFA